MTSLIIVKAAYDAEASVWYVEHSDLAGLNVEAHTIEALRQKLPGAVLDLLEAQGASDFDISIEIIAHTSIRARGAVAA